MQFDRERLVNTLLYLANKKPRIGFHKMFKILYFADQKHLAKYGRTIIGDRYIAMQNGPVPSRTYDILKAVKQPWLEVTEENYFLSKIIVEKHHISARIDADLDYLAESEVECLNKSFDENHALSYNNLTNKSHGYAWTRADMNNRISLVDIAKEAEADTEIIEHIIEMEEAEKVFSWYH
ncbi:MAG TPA: DUF4065 domain-containing protein [Bacteroidetes bacterium]|nr:DUF4065 domain-containing protein [Bacteroidota bacterium]